MTCPSDGVVPLVYPFIYSHWNTRWEGEWATVVVNGLAVCFFIWRQCVPCRTCITLDFLMYSWSFVFVWSGGQCLRVPWTRLVGCTDLGHGKAIIWPVRVTVCCYYGQELAKNLLAKQINKQRASLSILQNGKFIGQAEGKSMQLWRRFCIWVCELSVCL